MKDIARTPLQLGNYIRETRRGFSLKQEQLAATVGLRHKTVSKLESTGNARLSTVLRCSPRSIRNSSWTLEPRARRVKSRKSSDAARALQAAECLPRQRLAGRLLRERFAAISSQWDRVGWRGSPPTRCGRLRPVILRKRPTGHGRGSRLYQPWLRNRCTGLRRQWKTSWQIFHRTSPKNSAARS